MIRNKLGAFGSSNQQVRLMTSSELDKCLKEALYTDAVGCSDSILFDISQATYHDGFFDKIMKAAWRCVCSRPGRARRIQKGLTLLNYLAINGSEACISEIVRNIDTLHSVTRLRFSQGNKELGLIIVDKATQLASLVLDSRALQDKRKYAASIRDRFVSVSSTNGVVETDMIHKPVYVLDRTKNPTFQSAPAHPPAFGGMAPAQPAGPGRRFLSKLFKSNLRVSNRPQNIGLYGSNLHANSSRSGLAAGFGFDAYGKSMDSGEDLTPTRVNDPSFNAFPVVNSAPDSYYQHNFSRTNDRRPAEQKLSPPPSRRTLSSEDSSFKRYSSTSDSSASSDTESYSSSETSSSSSPSRYRRANRSKHRTRPAHRAPSPSSSSSDGSESLSEYSSSATSTSTQTDYRRRAPRRPAAPRAPPKYAPRYQPQYVPPQSAHYAPRAAAPDSYAQPRGRPDAFAGRSNPFGRRY